MSLISYVKCETKQNEENKKKNETDCFRPNEKKTNNGISVNINEHGRDQIERFAWALPMRR